MIGIIIAFSYYYRVVYLLKMLQFIVLVVLLSFFMPTCSQYGDDEDNYDPVLYEAF